MAGKRRKRYNAGTVGKLRLRVARILAKQFPELDIRPEDMRPATGRWRSDRRLDVYRWEVFTRSRDGLNVIFGCWDTMTQFAKDAAKAGCHLSDGTLYAGPATPLDPTEAKQGVNP